MKLGLMKNFTKALDRIGPAFSFLCEKFPKLRTQKMQTGAFSVSQISQLFTDPQFDLVLSDDEKADCSAFRHVATGFLGNINPPN
jgi:hypothetical protein